MDEPAFPSVYVGAEPSCNQCVNIGMSLRDWFAGQSVAASVAVFELAFKNPMSTIECNPDTIAAGAYSIADAILNTNGAV